MSEDLSMFEFCYFGLTYLAEETGISSVAVANHTCASVRAGDGARSITRIRIAWFNDNLAQSAREPRIARARELVDFVNTA